MAQIFCRLGCPSTRIYNNALYYGKGEFPKLCNTLGMKIASVSVYHMEANGIAQAKLRHSKESYGLSWNKNSKLGIKISTLQFLPSTLATMKERVSPLFTHHGFEVNMPGIKPMGLKAEEIKRKSKYEKDMYKRYEGKVNVRRRCKSAKKKYFCILYLR